MTNEPDRILYEIDAERARLERKLAMLNDRVSVDALKTEAGHHVRAASGDVIDRVLTRLGHSAQAHPLAVAAVGAGVSWLLSGGAGAAARPDDTAMRRSMGSYNGPKPAGGDPDRETPVSVAAHSQPRAPDAIDTVQARAKGAVETAQAQLAALRRQADDMRNRVAEGTDELSSEARARVIAAREKALEAAQYSGRKARDAGQAGTAFAKENPMIVGGLALALGAAVAGALYIRNSGKAEGDEDDAKLDAFAEADRVFEDELARARAARNAAAQGIPDN